MANVFEEVNKLASRLDYFFEHAVQVNPALKIVTAGINVDHEQAEGPLFISADELRRMADESERITAELMARRNA